MVIVARSNSMVWLRRVRFWALALLGLVIGHEAVYVAAYGPSYQAAMSSTGHDYWLRFALATLAIGGIPLGVSAVGLLRLGGAIRAVRRASAESAAKSGLPLPVESVAAPSYASEVISLLPRLFLTVLAGFTVQENVEAALSGQGFPGLWALGSGVVLPVMLTVAALLSLAGAWLRWREFVLEQRLAVARACTARRRSGATRTPARWHDVAAGIAHQWLIARQLAGRAPPGSLHV